MKIRQFQELYYISSSNDMDIDKSVKMIGVITGKTPDEVDLMKRKKFLKLCKSITKQFEIFGTNLLKGKPRKMIRVGWKLFRIHYDITKQPLNAGRYVEGITFSKDIVNNLHKIMATIATPIKWSWKELRFVEYKLDHSDIAAIMEEAKFSDAYQCAVFFYTLYSSSIQIIQPYLVKEMEKAGMEKQKAEETLNGLHKILDGFTMPKWSLNMKEYLLNRFGILGQYSS
jgi:hypothetical protein